MDPKPYFKCRDDLLSLIKKEDINEPIYFHTDQGSVYSSISVEPDDLSNDIIVKIQKLIKNTNNI